MMILLDTNILVFAHNKKSPYHSQANRLVKDAFQLKFQACIAQQNLLEFFSVITDSRRIQKPLLPQTALRWLNAYLRSTKIIKIYPSSDTLANTIAMAKVMSLSRAEIFDSYLVATMQENGISTIYTDNISHFQKYSEIKAINPFTT